MNVKFRYLSTVIETLFGTAIMERKWYKVWVNRIAFNSNRRSATERANAFSELNGRINWRFDGETEL